MALAKSDSVITVDEWQNVPAGTLAVGANGAIATGYENIFIVRVALVEAVAQDGCTVIVEISYDGNDWTKLTSVQGTSETPATTTINDAEVLAAETSITLTDATTGDFDIPGRLWYIKDGTIANSEAVRTKVNSTHTVTLCDGLLRAHANGLNVYDRCDEFVFDIPMPVSYVRALVYNSDADADVDFTSMIMQVTGI